MTRRSNPYAPRPTGIPQTSVRGLPIITGGNGSLLDIGEWPEIPTMPFDKTWIQPGLITVASGVSGYLPGWFCPVPPGTTCAVIAVWAYLRSGSAVFELQMNGIAIIPGIAVTSTLPTSPSATPVGFIDVMNGFYFAPVCDSISGTPDGLTFGLFLDRQINTE